MNNLKSKVAYAIIVAVLLLTCGALGVLSFTGCKSTIVIPDGISDECRITWALIIAFHESSKNDDTKSAVALLLQKSQENCIKSIDTARLRKTSLKCRDLVYGKDAVVDLSDLPKKELFISCIRIEEGEIK